MRHLFARARNDNKLRQLCQFIRLPPLVEFCRVVGADEIKQFRSRKFFCVLTQCVKGVGNAAAPDFLVVNLAICPARQREPEQLQADAGAGLLSGLKGDCAAGMKKSLSSPSSSIAACATSRWPRWTGSNEPPKIPNFILIWRALLRQCPIILFILEDIAPSMI